MDADVHHKSSSGFKKQKFEYILREEFAISVLLYSGHL